MKLISLKKGIITACMLLVSATAFTACGAAKEEPTTEADYSDIKEEIVQFVNVDVPAIAADRDTAVASYNAYFDETQEMDSQAWLEKLRSEAIVDYEVYLYNLKEIEVKTPEVTELKDLYVESAQAQYDAMQSVITALENSDNTYLDTAQEQILASQDALLRYEQKLKELCETYDIAINGSFTELGNPSSTEPETTDAPAEDVPSDEAPAEDAPAEETPAEN